MGTIENWMEFYFVHTEKIATWENVHMNDNGDDVYMCKCIRWNVNRFNCTLWWCWFIYVFTSDIYQTVYFAGVLTSCEMFGLVEMCGNIPKSDKHEIEKAIKNRRWNGWDISEIPNLCHSSISIRVYVSSWLCVALATLWVQPFNHGTSCLSFVVNSRKTRVSCVGAFGESPHNLFIYT